MALHSRKATPASHHAKLAFTGFLLGVALMCTGGLITYLLGAVVWTDIGFNVSEIFFSIAVIAVMAIAEEFVFRAWLLRKLRRRFNDRTSLALSSLLFMLLHLGNAQLNVAGAVNVFLGGLMFGMFYIETRSLAFVAAVHFAWNFFQGPLLGFAVSGVHLDSMLTAEINNSHALNGGPFGFEGSYVCTAILLLVCSAVQALRTKRQSSINN